jgi:hypothetical protein
MRRIVLSGVLASMMLLVGVAPSASADTQTARTWAGAAQLAGEDGSLWQPTFRAGVKRSGPISVTTDTFPNDGDPQQAMAVFASYGNNQRGFTILQKYAETAWAADPEPNRAAAPVGTFTVRLGDPDTSIAIRAEVSANCYLPKDLLNPPPPPSNLRCSKADVKRYGATLTMTAKPPSTMTAPGTTDVVIQSRGITFKQLMHIASSLQQIMS